MTVLIESNDLLLIWHLRLVIIKHPFKLLLLFAVLCPVSFDVALQSVTHGFVFLFLSAGFRELVLNLGLLVLKILEALLHFLELLFPLLEFSVALILSIFTCLNFTKDLFSRCLVFV